MRVVLVLAVLAWLWLSESEPAAAASTAQPNTNRSSCPTDGTIGCAVEIGGGQIGPGEPLLEAAATNLNPGVARRLGEAISPPPLPSKPGPGGGLTL